MIIYNVTIKLQQAIHEEWLLWLKEEHMPEVIATGCFTRSTILRLLEVDDADGPTYAVQYFAKTRLDYARYIERYAGQMRQKSFDKWGDKFIAFRSLMEVVS